MVDSFTQRFGQGFALPTVLIASVVLMVTLLAVLTGMTATTASLDLQRQEQLARDAAEAGLVKAQECIKKGAWSNGLYPGPGCGPGLPSCAPNTATPDPNDCLYYLLKESNVRTTFRVEVTGPTDNVYTFKSTGTYERISKSSSTVVANSQQTVYSKYAIDLSTAATKSDSGYGQVCALLKLGTSTVNEAYCWGENSDGRAGIGALGSGDTNCTSVTYTAKRNNSGSCEPTYRKVKDTRGTVALSTYDRMNGSQLSAARTREFKAQEVDIASGGSFACAISADATATFSSRKLFCWGSNADNRLGFGAGITASTSHGCETVSGVGTVCHTPVPVATPWSASYYPVSVVAGLDFACTLVKTSLAAASGLIYCWGDNSRGQLGCGGPSGQSPCSGASYATPQLVRAYTGASGSSLATKSIHTSMGQTMCAINSADRALCWGRNEAGQVGGGVATDSLASVTYPARVIDPTSGGTTQFQTVSRIATSGPSFEHGPGGHTCAIGLGDGKIYCWGRNEFGELGKTLNTGQTHRAYPISGVYNPSTGSSTTSYIAYEIATAYKSTCAIISVGGGPRQVYCWGRGSLLGVGAVSTCPSSSGDPENNIATQCSLANSTPNSSTGGIPVRYLPAPVKAFSTEAPTSIIGGGARFCAIAGVSNYCWGANTVGQIGDKTTTNRVDPTKSKFLETPGNRLYF